MDKQDIVVHYKNETIGRVAFWGLHSITKTIASFVIGLSKNNNLKFYNSEEDALERLNAIGKGDL